MFDISAVEFLVLGIAALFIFGPDRLPEMARKAAQTVRAVRAMAANARRDFTKELGPELEDLDVRDLNPRSFVKKHLLDDVESDLDLKKDLDLGEDLEVDLDDGNSRRSRSRSRRRSRARSSANGSTSTDRTAGKATGSTDSDPQPARESADGATTGQQAATTANGAAGASSEVAEATTVATADPDAEAADLATSGLDPAEPEEVPAVMVLARQAAPPFDYEAT